MLEMKAVEKSFPTPTGPVRVLQPTDLEVKAGDFLAITGPSGSGKTTLLMLAALLSRPSKGAVVFDGDDVSSKDEAWLCRHRKYRVGMVFQKFCLLPHRTVLENVLFRFRYLDHDPDEARTRSLEALRAMGLESKVDQPARLLSSGEMQRVAIARAVALPPRFLVADEPTGNLDRESTLRVMDCFKRLNAEGLTMLLVTHNEELLNYCSRHLVCRGGALQKSK
ncbi:MAG: hypothetical protein A2X46_10455 [Lentisphaerae bacterium GWF2_57_35]|nr:MAG: hypothetical protein A2X46_10455 [Lentisphaerae bacterium GWF2_57_35]